jgi:hypothetical protein
LAFVLISCSRQGQLALSTRPAPLNFQVGESGSGSFTLANQGNAPLAYTLSTDSSNIKFSKTTGRISEKRSETVKLIATCESLGTSSETILVQSDGGEATLEVALNCTTAPNSTYNIDIRFIGDTTTDEQKAAFAQAELRWEGIITEEFEDAVLPAPNEIDSRLTQFCDPAEPNLTGETVDDLIILAKVGPIDGAGSPTSGNILAQAGPVLIRTGGDQLTLLGCMIFDEADIDELLRGGSFTNVVTHEMGHVLGIGTFWDEFFDRACPRAGNVGFTGTNSVIEFGVLTQTVDDAKPLIETQGGPGTACGHWDEGFYDAELMTGLAEAPGIRMPLSKLTIASLEDIGYTVDYSQADEYALPTCKPNCQLTEPQTQGGAWEVLLQPVASIDAKGNIVLLRQAE